MTIDDESFWKEQDEVQRAILLYGERINLLSQGLLEKRKILNQLQSSDQPILVYTEKFHQGMSYRLDPSDRESLAYWGLSPIKEKELVPEEGACSFHFYYDFGFNISEVYVNDHSIQRYSIRGSIVDYEHPYSLGEGVFLIVDVYAKQKDTPEFQKEIIKYQESIAQDQAMLNLLKDQCLRLEVRQKDLLKKKNSVCFFLRFSFFCESKNHLTLKNKNRKLRV